MNVISVRILDANVASLDDLITTQAFLQLVDAQVTANGHDTPESVTESLRLITNELDERLRGDLLRELKVTDAQIEALKSQDQKRKEALVRKADLEARLGQTQKSQTAKPKGR